VQGEIRIILAGGGTGGHVFPAIRIAQHLKEQWGARCRFIGTKNGLENVKVPQAGFVLKNIWISGLHRRLDLRNLIFPLKVVISLMQSKKEIREFQPDLVIGTGGYVSGPVLFQASRMGIPTAIQEQNSFPGITTRLLSGRVDLVLVAYEEALKHLKKVQAYKIVGNPVSVYGNVNRNDACRMFDLDPGEPVILVFGGSQGARNINRAMDSLLSRDLLDQTQVIWQTGKSNFDQYREKFNGGVGPGLRLYPFIDRMDLAYGASDLVICRAGAMTLAEIAAAGLPAILVPLASAAGNHQLKNAQTISAGGGAFIVEDNDNITENLAAAIKTILGSPDKRKEMSEKIRRFYHPDCLNVMTQEFATLIRSAESGDPE
jgi:UDP-N-acetylglucosamine--N-acetylmuramyl-(pentapeptide) pyrophosphoryl-undecaprenol N-acetylglucosamine transferase